VRDPSSVERHVLDSTDAEFVDYPGRSLLSRDIDYIT